jgi:hypothetical protein
VGRDNSRDAVLEMSVPNRLGSSSPDPDHEMQVARYLSAAYVAYVHGQGMDYTRKKYADSPVGNFWLEIARLVIEGMAMGGEKAFPVQPKGPIQ